MGTVGRAQSRNNQPGAYLPPVRPRWLRWWQDQRLPDGDFSRRSAVRCPGTARPVKIAIVRQRYNPFGGAERFVERALGALAGDGAAVTLITRNWDGAPRAGFKQITCDPSYSRLTGGRAARDKSFAAAVQAELARGDYDITQSHERIPGCMIFSACDGGHA